MSKRRVLILCTGNSARSQMAEGLLRSIAGDRFEVFSAGTKPVAVNSHAVAAMAELGIDISRHRSKPVSEFEGQTFDFVITVCDHARETCPWLPGAAHRVHKSFEDPAAATPWQQPAKFREVGEQIRAWVEEFVRQQS